jgi:hypothetical protein
MRLFAADLRNTGELRDDLDDDTVADPVWSMNAPEYFLLIRSRGWTPEHAAMVRDVWIGPCCGTLPLTTTRAGITIIRARRRHPRRRRDQSAERRILRNGRRPALVAECDSVVGPDGAGSSSYGRSATMIIRLCSAVSGRAFSP